eukprot:scaffold117308_cov45-Phaeocystis_antarctica.AAC.1
MVEASRARAVATWAGSPRTRAMARRRCRCCKRSWSHPPSPGICPPMPVVGNRSCSCRQCGT